VWRASLRRRAPLKRAQALIFDSWFDASVRRGAGACHERPITRHMQTGLCFEQRSLRIQALGALTPKPNRARRTRRGRRWLRVVANITARADARMGDTVIERRARHRPAGFERSSRMVFAGLFPCSRAITKNLRDALVKLQLNDPAFSTSRKIPLRSGTAPAAVPRLAPYGIVRSGWNAEFGINLITTAPSVRYRIRPRPASSSKWTAHEISSAERNGENRRAVITAMIITAEDSVGAIRSSGEENAACRKTLSTVAPAVTHLLLTEVVVLDFTTA